MGENKILNFLVVEDELEICEIICLFLGGQYCAQFSTATSGNEAIEIIKANAGAFHVVISDYNMPNGNGAVLFDFLKNNYPNIPFLLITSDSWGDHPEFHKANNVGYLQKPFIDDTLIEEVDRLLSSTTFKVDRNHQYVGVSIQTLAKIGEIVQPLYVKLNDDKFVKIMNVTSSFSHEDVARFKLKQINILYVEKQFYREFISKFRQKVISEMIFRGSKVVSIEALSLSTSVQEVILAAVKTFGWSQETQDMAIKNMQIVKNLVEKNEKLQSVFQRASDTDHDYIFVHSILNCFMTTALTQAYKFKNEFAQEYLALASFFHDASLENHQVKNEGRFLNAAALKLTINKEDWLWIKDHTEVYANMLALWSPCPKEVINIIKQHHERPDGSGFPKGLISSQIDELAACFIVAEDIVISYLELKDRLSVEKHLRSLAGKYQDQPFNTFYQLALDIFYHRQEKKKGA
jgi:response regulator RpfG family c-di-GMP phosphodiesterase